MLWLLLACTSRPPNVVFIVLDTVRADRVSSCGADRDTTPVLSALPGQLTCTAVAPGSWTLPSHASYFTGVMPVEHGAHSLTSGVGDLSGSGNRARPLNDRLPTVAEHFKGLGYQTVAVSGNPVVSDKMGLMRGFDHVDVATAWGRMFEEDLAEAVQGQLAEVDPERPLFLFVNIADAHQPWRKLPDDAPWGAGTPTRFWSKTAEQGPWVRYVRGELPAEEWAPIHRQTVDLYDAAVHRADASLGVVLKDLRDGGWCGDDCRVVITSDHGEFLGEHGLLDHGHEVWDENAVVPLYTSHGDLPGGWVSALTATALLTGVERAHPATSEAWPHVRRCARAQGQAFCDIVVGDWTGPTKQVWLDGVVLDEVDGQRTASSAPSQRLVRQGAQVRKAARDDGRVDFQVEELLRAAGYVD